MGERVDEQEKQPEIQEQWFPEWLEWGFGELDAYLLKHARFEDYYRRHREEDQGAED